MKILITGGTGFTGSHLAQKLYKLGYAVRLLVRNTSKIDMFSDVDVEIAYGDITNAVSVDRATKGVDAVFHIAAAFRTSAIPDKAYWDTNLKGTENLLESSKKNAVNKFIHCSTVGIHGHVNHPPADENSPLAPDDIYQLTKLKAEIRATEFSRETGLPLTVIRPCPIYGPGDMRLYKLFKIASKKIVPILGSGEIFFHMVYIDDLVDAFIKALEIEKAIGETFIIGGRQILTLNQIIDEITKQLNIKPIKIHFPVKSFQIIGTLCEKIFIPLRVQPPIYRRRVDFFTKSRAFNITKAKNLLNYRPRVDIQEGLSRTINWYRDNRLL